MIVFGSCNHQKFPQEYWLDILKEKPETFLWIGDAVYAKNNTLAGLQYAYDKQLNSPYYKEFQSKIQIMDGVYDDHDYGVNDGGRFVDDKDLRKKLFLDYIQFDKQYKSNKLPNDEGLYHDHDFLYNMKNDNDDAIKLKVIFLDTRTFRDHPFIKSVGEFEFPLSALIAAAVRTSYGILGLGQNHNGDMLGQAQWSWLENTLLTSDADYHIIVSTIQIFTTNPVVESWQHFPQSKKKLVSLLKKTDPKGLAFLSGDVHLGEISRVKVERNDNTLNNVWPEITSSGLTHSCRLGIVQDILCPVMLKTFSKHRDPNDEYYAGKNYGTIEFDNQSMNISVKSLEQNEKGNTVLQFNVPYNNNHHTEYSKSKITNVQYEALPVLNNTQFYSLFIIVIMFIVILLRSLFSYHNKKKSGKGKKKN